MDRAASVRVDGLLAPYATGFREELAGRGYTTRSAQTHLLLMAGLSRWLEGIGLELAALTSERAEDFLRDRRSEGHRFPRSADGLVPLLRYLREVGGVPPATPRVRTPAEELLARFGVYLAGERGLAAGTIIGYQHAGALLFAMLDVIGRDLEGLTPADVQKFLLAECANRSVCASKSLVTGLRSLLHFLHVEGITAVPLAGAVPAVSGWSGTSVPRGIDARSVQRLLASCDRRTVKGARDFAVLTLLCRLGVRAGEVTALKLTDIDWRAGELVVHGKGSRLERLPLPVDVGEALAAYVRHGRPRSDVPLLFLRVLAPQRGLTVSGISEIVHSACDRAGVPSVGTHRLRHTVASELLRSGAGLAEIGQLLRHRSIATTSAYAKVDTDALRQLARPWPGGAA